jgi:hypothetical protein
MCYEEKKTEEKIEEENQETPVSLMQMRVKSQNKSPKIKECT